MTDCLQANEFVRVKVGNCFEEIPDLIAEIERTCDCACVHHVGFTFFLYRCVRLHSPPRTSFRRRPHSLRHTYSQGAGAAEAEGHADAGAGPSAHRGLCIQGVSEEEERTGGWGQVVAGYRQAPGVHGAELALDGRRDGH